MVVVMKRLTARQEKFALAVGKGTPRSEAYRKFYKTDGWPDRQVNEASRRLALRPQVAERIKKLTERKTEAAEAEFDMTVKKLLQTYIEIAFTDPNELTSMRRGACRHCWGIDGAYQWKEWEFEEALARWQTAHDLWDRSGGGDNEPACPDPAGGFGFLFKRAPNPECLKCEGDGELRMHVQDTTLLSPGAKHLYRGVQQTKDGIKVLFGDKDKALDSIGRMLGAFDDRLRVDLKGAVAAIGLTTADPVEAANMYERMLTAPSS